MCPGGAGSEGPLGPLEQKEGKAGQHMALGHQGWDRGPEANTASTYGIFTQEELLKGSSASMSVCGPRACPRPHCTFLHRWQAPGISQAQGTVSLVPSNSLYPPTLPCTRMDTFLQSHLHIPSHVESEMLSACQARIAALRGCGTYSVAHGWSIPEGRLLSCTPS